jgi:competence protein ComEA
VTNIEELVFRFRWQIALLLIGFILSAGGVFLTLQDDSPEFEVIGSENTTGKLIVEVSGAVENAGVYELAADSRIEHAIGTAGGLSIDADSVWVEKYLNRAAYVVDGQKIYIPSQSEQSSDNNQGVYQTESQVLSSDSSDQVNINAASQNELEELPGIGPVYAQKIIDNRPYSSVEELLVKKAVTQKIYDENKGAFSLY